MAVLPFRCLSDKKSDVYFADGITEDVANGLSVWRWFPVIGRYTSGQSGNTDVTIQSVARESGTRYVIGDSLRRSGSRYRITTELSDAGTGQQLWSQQFDGSPDDIFEIQDRISNEVARQVEPEDAELGVQTEMLDDGLRCADQLGPAAKQILRVENGSNRANFQVK